MENLLHGHGWVGPGAQRGLGVDEFALSVVNSLAISASPSSPFALSTGGRGIEGGGGIPIVLQCRLLFARQGQPVGD